jgi:hypothetical protein|tara:strand:- start:5250 stop:5417 length:168 start_codon:yes stop_codon:yes gene_type:complete
MLNRLEDYSERDLTVALASPNWSQEEIDNFEAEQLRRKEINRAIIQSVDPISCQI